ncbi:YokU family protein [Guptibacillus algicola]|uniref:YokU family protein n=1 Tax=Guptibacillus algicola TaxID=225844 RepID=UPI001CD45737|nr:YokU family protein [Alkalihalobacillus algicola]MCA0988191.1 YokU family protein [Alkalihalobacillus algicola]
MNCKWCDKEGAFETLDTGYWELPDGSRAVEINELPSIQCIDCGMCYQTDELVGDVEEQLMLIDTSKLSSSFTFKELMDQPRLLKKNYFDIDRYPLK